MAEEKPYDPTPGRLQKAKRDGNVARSMEIGTAVTFGAGIVAVAGVMPTMRTAIQRWFERLATDPDASGVDLTLTLFGAALVPFVAALAAGVIANLVQIGGLTVVPPKLKLERLNPSENLKRIVSPQSALAAARAVLAFVAATASVVPTAKLVFVRATGISSVAVFGSLVAIGVGRVVASVLLIACAFAVFDYLLVRANWRKKLKMTLYEIRKEHQENEGDPRLRGRRRGRHKSLVSGAVSSVKKAAFVVTNPTHLAVALEYAPPEIAVPRVLVMGADETAARIRALAHEHAIPLVENVALARMLWETAAVGRTVPRESFIAVAEIVNALGVWGAR